MRVKASKLFSRQSKPQQFLKIETKYRRRMATAAGSPLHLCMMQSKLLDSSNESSIQMKSAIQQFSKRGINCSLLDPNALTESQQSKCKVEGYLYSRLAAGHALRAMKRSSKELNPEYHGVGISPACLINTDAAVFLTVWSRKFVRTEEINRADVFEAAVDKLIQSTSSSTRCTDFLAELVIPLKTGQVPYVAVDEFGRTCTEFHSSSRRLLLPGSFNPLHIGHVNMLESAAQYLTQSGQKFELVAFELSAFNVDKPPLSDDAILDRAAQFAGKFSCIFTNAPTFIMKARLHPNTTFILGYDTAIRLIMPKYYENSEEKMSDAFLEFQQLGSRFLVACRAATPDSRAMSLEDIEFPSNFRFKHLFMALPSTAFRVDISSTAIRLGEIGTGL